MEGVREMICAAGVNVPKGARCTVCGAGPHQKCQKKIKDKRAERERQRVKQVADRAAERAAMIEQAEREVG